MTILEPATEIMFRLDSDPSFKSTGYTLFLDPDTGKLVPEMYVMLPHTDNQVHLWVKYKDRNGRMMGPWDFTLDPGIEAARGDKNIVESTKPAWVSFRKFNDEMLLYFPHLMSWRGGISKIYYGVNKEDPDTEFRFPPHLNIGTARIPDEFSTHINVPSDVKFVTVRVVYFDRTQSEIVKFESRNQKEDSY